jgi:hypothetical protein
MLMAVRNTSERDAAQAPDQQRQHGQEGHRHPGLGRAAAMREKRFDRACLAPRLAVARGEEGPDDPLLRHLVARELGHDLPAREHEHPVADARQLLCVRGVDDAGAALGDVLADGLVDLVAGAGVDALRRLVDQEGAGAPTGRRAPAPPSAGCRPIGRSPGTSRLAAATPKVPSA